MVVAKMPVMIAEKVELRYCLAGTDKNTFNELAKIEK